MAQRITIDLEPAAVVKGEVRLVSKLGAEGYVKLNSAAQDHFSVNLHDTGGRFEFDRLPPGLYTLGVTGTGGQLLHTTKVTLEAGVTHAEVVTLPSRDH